MYLRKLMTALLLISPTLWAQTPTAPVPEPSTLEEAKAQRARATQMKKAADQLYASEQEACYKKLLVNDCLEAAKKRHTQSIVEARNLDIPARHFEREAKRADVEAKEAKRAADLPAREADQQAQGQQYRSDEAIKAAERQQKIDAKNRKAIEKRRKLADEQAKRQLKNEKRAKKDTERAADKRR